MSAGLGGLCCWHSDPSTCALSGETNMGSIGKGEDNTHSNSGHQLSKHQKPMLPVFVSPERAQVEGSLHQQHRPPRPADMANLCALLFFFFLLFCNTIV